MDGRGCGDQDGPGPPQRDERGAESHKQRGDCQVCHERLDEVRQVPGMLNNLGHDSPPCGNLMHDPPEIG